MAPDTKAHRNRGDFDVKQFLVEEIGCGCLFWMGMFGLFALLMIYGWIKSKLFLNQTQNPC